MGTFSIRSFAYIASFTAVLPLTATALDLSQAYQLALKNDPQYASALANFRVVQERMPQARAALRPTLNWTMGATANISRSLSSTVNNDASDISRTNQINTNTTNSTSNTTEGSNNSISTSGSTQSDSTNSSILKESSTISNASEGWSEPLQTQRSRTLASALVFSMPLYRPALDAQFEQSKLIVQQAKLQLQASKVDVAIKVTQAYFDVVVAEENIVAIAAQKISTSEQLASAKHNFEVGSATITDVHEAQAKFDLIKAQEINALNEKRVRLFALRAMIGPLPSAVFRLHEDHKQPFNPLTENIATWASKAENESLSVLIQKIAVQIANIEVVKQNAVHKPTLDLNANAGMNRSYARNANDTVSTNTLSNSNQTNSNTFTNGTSTSTGNSGTGTNSSINSSSTTISNSDNNSQSNSSTTTNTNISTALTKSRTFEKNASISLQFAMPLYEGGLFDSRVREALAQVDKADADLNAALATTTLNVNKSFYGVISSLAQVEAYVAAINSNEMAVNSNKLGYAVGMRLNIDVLNAQQQLFAARRDLARARVDVLLNSLQLKAAVGNLQETDIQSANEWLIPNSSEIK